MDISFKRLRFCRLSFHRSIRAHAMHDGCESGSNLEVARRLFLLSSASNRATIDLRLTTFVCVASASATLRSKLLKGASSIKISFKFLSNCQKILRILFKTLFLPNFPHFLKISFKKEISFEVEALVFRKTISEPQAGIESAILCF